MSEVTNDNVVGDDLNSESSCVITALFGCDLISTSYKFKHNY